MIENKKHWIIFNKTGIYKDQNNKIMIFSNKSSVMLFFHLILENNKMWSYGEVCLDKENLEHIKNI